MELSGGEIIHKELNLWLNWVIIYICLYLHRSCATFMYTTQTGTQEKSRQPPTEGEINKSK